MNPVIKYEVILYWSAEDDAFIAEVPELPGCMADGMDYHEALANVEQIAKEWNKITAIVRTINSEIREAQRDFSTIRTGSITPGLLRSGRPSDMAPPEQAVGPSHHFHSTPE